MRKEYYPAKCPMIIVPSHEGSPDIECGKPTTRYWNNLACCADCYEACIKQEHEDAKKRKALEAERMASEAEKRKAAPCDAPCTCSLFRTPEPKTKETIVLELRPGVYQVNPYHHCDTNTTLDLDCAYAWEPPFFKKYASAWRDHINVARKQYPDARWVLVRTTTEIKREIRPL